MYIPLYFIFRILDSLYNVHRFNYLMWVEVTRFLNFCLLFCFENTIAVGLDLRRQGQYEPTTPRRGSSSASSAAGTPGEPTARISTIFLGTRQLLFSALI